MSVAHTNKSFLILIKKKATYEVNQIAAAEQVYAVGTSLIVSIRAITDALSERP